MLESIDFAQLLDEYAIPWLINVIFAILIFVVGRMVVSLVVSVAKSLMSRAKVDPMLIHFLASILTGLLVLVVVVASIDQLGVDTTSFIAIVGAAGLAVGLALQKSLGNFAAGVMLIVFKPFKVGDFVEAGGRSGVVTEIRIFNTVMNTPDNRLVIVPNGAIYENTIVNYSALDTRRIDMVFGVSYTDDLKRAKAILEAVVTGDERILPDPEPVIRVAELADSSVNFDVRPWVKREDYWMVRSDIMEKVKLSFDANGITIPFPQRDLHLIQEKGTVSQPGAERASVNRV